ncbi:acyl-CoA carboxylase epsilon subunit [Streptomyces sp. NPDC057686]|uniref:acyl-CoA carboxylase epsilon subunit n=1 Tax=Streptomyces sp. NPDC057686 TaxID=3346212 RepID=UPI0036B07A36
MSIVEERPLATELAPAPAFRAPSVRVAPVPQRPVQPPARTEGLPAGAAEPSLALAMASIRISRGNPTAEETAALAVLLTARLRLLHEARGSGAVPRVRRLPRPARPPFRAPGAWAS